MVCQRDPADDLLPHIFKKLNGVLGKYVEQHALRHAERTEEKPGIKTPD